MSERTTWFWPLPGGKDQYLETLAMILDKISREHDFDKLVKLVSKELDVDEGWTGKSIAATVISPGFARKDGRRILLTDVGTEFLTNKSPDLVLERLLDRIWGIREALLWLKKENLSLREIHSKCIGFGANWGNISQVDYRLRWLHSLACVEKKNMKWLLTSKGSKISEELVEKGLTPERVDALEQVETGHEEAREVIEPEITSLEMNDVERSALVHLMLGRNLVFYGSPGTGKTRVAVSLTERICGKDNFTFETGNAEWTTYDIVGGPTLIGPGKLIFRPGTLTASASRCKQSWKEKGYPHWLIIDELNRANLDLAFGKVFSLLDVDYRSRPILNENELQGMGNSEEFKDLRIPAEFRIVATMNTFDRAMLFSLGYAFRRRFAFVEVTSPFSQDVSEEGPQEGIGPNEQNWKEKVMGAEKEAAADETENEIDRWIESASFPLPNEFEVALVEGSNLRAKLRNLEADIKTGKLDPFHPHRFACGLARLLATENIIELGYSQPVDVIKYALMYLALFEQEEVKAQMVKALDEAVKAYFIPQMEYYLPEARRMMTLGNKEEAESVEAKFKGLSDFFLQLGLVGSGKKMLKTVEKLRSGETRVL